MGPSDTSQPKTGTCPKCLGAKLIPNEWYPEFGKPERPCNNCGGQQMLSGPSGVVPLRPDGTPCLHEYKLIRERNCYRQYECTHCGHRYDYDSGD